MITLALVSELLFGKLHEGVDLARQEIKEIRLVFYLTHKQLFFDHKLPNGIKM